MLKTFASAARHLTDGHLGLALMNAGIPSDRVQRLKRAAGNAGPFSQGWNLLRYVSDRAVSRLIAQRRIELNRSLLSTSANVPLHVNITPPARLLTVHQFHSGSAVGDAVTNAMFLMQQILRGMGYVSEIFVEHRDPLLSELIFEFGDLPTHGDYILIVRHSMGHGVFEPLLALQARKILLYHNITPPEFLGEVPWFIPYSELGRRQLAQLHDQVWASLADSEYNWLELKKLGYQSPAVCSLLFDLQTMRDRFAAESNHSHKLGGREQFTVLFVGRVTESKGQAELVDAFAEFARQYGGAARLVLVGKFSSIEDTYPAEILRRAAMHGLTDQVTLTGPVTDDELERWFRVADAYVSLSLHEGFGVPLIESMARGLPVVAWPCSAVAYTVGDAAMVLLERTPAAVAAALMRIANEPEFRRELIARQSDFIERYELGRHLPALRSALLAAGAAPPADAALRQSLIKRLHVTFTGHIGGSYSLAIVNRTMAQNMEARRPGLQRLVGWENGTSNRLDDIPAGERVQIQALLARSEPASAPNIVISQHYPIHVPTLPGHRLAMLFWEESLLPQAMTATLNENFEAVLVPTAFVGKALVDSGVSIPIINAGYAPDLAPFYRVGAQRARRQQGQLFSFLHLSSCFPRKGADLLIAAFAAAFRKSDDVRLVIKTFPNPHNDIIEQVARLRTADPDIADIVVINQDYDNDELLKLFYDADAMVLPTRGEGFNLPAAEAMAAGIPVVVTGHGGHLDFVNARNSRLVAFDFEQSRSHVAGSASVWAEPDVADLTLAFRELYDDRGLAHSPSMQRAARAAIDIRQKLAASGWMDRLLNGAIDVVTMRNELPRIAWVSTWDVHCGVAEYSRFLLEQLLADDRALAAKFSILCDDRTLPQGPFRGGDVIPAWTLDNHPDVVDRLARNIAKCDPEVLVIQHQPGLISWGNLIRLLQDRRVKDRITVVTLHSIQSLLGMSALERQTIIAALRGATRILVHQVADINSLKQVGLVDNVTYFPHGAPARQQTPPARPLKPGAAPLIGSYGFFLPGKGLHRLIEALVPLRKRWPRIRLRLVNSVYPSSVSDTELARCRQLAIALKVSDLIDWNTEFQLDGASLQQLKECDVIALPYDESPESASGAVRIALASGAPVAVTPARIFNDLGNAVFRVEDISSEALARGLETLLADDGLRRYVQDDAATWLAQRDWANLGLRLKGMLIGLHRGRRFNRTEPTQGF